MKNNKRTIAFVIMLITLLGCSYFSPKTSKVAIYSVDGIWSGYSDQQELVMFLIRDNSLSKFYFGTSRDCPYGKKDFYLFDFTHDKFMPPIWVKENQLSFAVNEIYETTPNKFKATFQSETTASGTFDIGWNIGPNCKGEKTITWQTVRNIIPSTDHCTKVLDSENDLVKIANGACIEKQVFWEGKKETRLFVKRAKGTEIVPYAQGSIFLILSPENVVIRYHIPPMIHISSDDVFLGQWHPWYQASPDDLISGNGLTRKGDQLLLPKSNLPVLEWNGSFYVALVDFYEPIERHDLSKD